MRRGSHWKRWPLLGAVLLSLLGAACGGGGGGSQTKAKVTVTISPSAITLVVNATQLFSAAVAGAKGVTIQTAVRANNVVTITTTAAHGLANGQPVTITGVSNTSFNGTFTVASVPSPTTFTYAQTAADATSGGGSAINSSVKWFVNDIEGGNATVGTITTAGLFTAPAALPPAVTATIASTNGASRTSNVVTITTTAAHNFVVGQIVFISGVADTTFNGSFLIASVPSTTTFTYGQSGNNATSSGGTVSSEAVVVKAVSIADSSATATAVVNISSGITVRVTPGSATVGTNENFQFIATVMGSSNNSVNWFVNGTPGGSSSVGTITSNGLYTAPATPPTSNTVSINSNGAVRASNTVTITTATAHGFQAGQSVVIAGVSDSSFNGTFTIASVPTTSTFTYAQTGPNATSGGGTAGSVSSTVTIKAVPAADSTRSATATVTVVVAADPTLTSISPTTAAQGSIFQDVYLTGTNFISTTVVQVNGTLVPATAVSSGVIRARIPDTLLAAAGTLSISAQRQNGTTTSTQSLTVSPVRPALVSATPDSGTQGGPAFSFNVNGGYFGAASLPAPVTAEFNGATRFATVTNARQLNVTIGPSDLTTPGLFSLFLRNSAATPPVAATNLAVQPSVSSIPSGPLVRLPVGSKPGAVAINTATGIAVVANHDSNDVTLIDLTSLVVVAPSIAVGKSPTGVAVDSLRNLAVVVNNTDKSLSVLDLGSKTVTATVDLSAVTAASPISVGLNPLTGRGLVAYQSTNAATLLDLTTSPPSVIGVVTASTGLNPQVAVEPRLNWALISPGGAGTLSIIDLGRQSVNAIASNGAVRSANIVTITTTTPHGLVTGQPVLISGMADSSFDGTFSVVSVPSSTTFTYSQTAANASSGGGTASYANALATGTLGQSVTGVSVNAETEKALLTDPGSPSVTIFSVLDQTPTSLLLEAGHVASAVNPLIDIGVTVNPSTDAVSVIDPRTPSRLAQISLGAGAHPKAVAIDPGSNLAVVADEGSNDVAILSLSTVPIRSLHITQINPPVILISSVDLTLTVQGKGFVGGSIVRLDGTSLSPPTSVTDRQMRVTVPAAMLAGPRRYALDVLNPGGVLSNVTDFTVIQAVDLTNAGAGCTTPAPRAVAIDPQRNVAVVTNPRCNDIAEIDLGSGTIIRRVAVGTNPQGVAVNSRIGKAVVTNRGSNNASIVNLDDGTVTATVTVDAEPLGVAINPNTATALVANSAANSISVFDATAGGAVTAVMSVDQRPVAVAIDPVQGLAVVANAASNTVTILDVTSATPTFSARVTGVQLPTAVATDPVGGLFLVTSSLSNSVDLVNAATQQGTPARIGINPTALAYNFQSGTLVTLNTASNTVSVMDFTDQQVRAVLGGPLVPQCQNPIVVGTPPLQQQQQPPCGVDIHPYTNLAVMADGDRNRLLLVPLPR